MLRYTLDVLCLTTKGPLSAQSLLNKLTIPSTLQTEASCTCFHDIKLCTCKSAQGPEISWARCSALSCTSAIDTGLDNHPGSNVLQAINTCIIASHLPAEHIRYRKVHTLNPSGPMYLTCCSLKGDPSAWNKSVLAQLGAHFLHLTSFGTDMGVRKPPTSKI